MFHFQSKSFKRYPRRHVEQLEPRCLLVANVVINEIHYDPPDKTQFAEFVELYNNSDVPVDLSGWRFSDGVDFRIPAGTVLNPRGYIVAAQDPATVKDLFGVHAMGPWRGELKNGGERIELRDIDGTVVDTVDYRRGFPWPTVGDEPGHSIELIHPVLANDVGGNWRRSQATGGSETLLSRGATWKYLPGTQEPSSVPGRWRQVGFDDSTWDVGVAPVGYGDGHVRTQLDMRNNYSTVYLRKTIDVRDATSVGNLTLRAQYDDGFNLWINGKHLVAANVSNPDAPFNATAQSALENLEFVDFSLPNSADYLIEGTNVIAVQLLNASRGGSSDAWFDAELVVEPSGNLSPGKVNTVFGENAPPAARKVSHGEGNILSGQDVSVTVLVTDPEGVASVTLEYQVVRPGDYFGRFLKANSNGSPVLNPRYDDPSEWTVVVMNDAGLAADSRASDDLFTGVIPASVHQHRNLIRYRIHVRDVPGASVQIPYADDMQYNFAYFVYDGIPTWTGSARPGIEPEVTYDFDELESIPTYHLLTSEGDHEDAQHIPNTSTSSYSGSEYLWSGTIVYDGKVYDHIRYRARGGVWRYAMGKNMWKFDFNRGRSFQAKDDYGQPYLEPWDKLNFSAVIQQGDYLHRGEQGLFESVGFKLFNLAGVESPNTHYVHFRIVDSADENGSDQFSGDFQGLYLAVEQPDGHLLDQHGLPDGNLYKIENYQGDSNNQGPTQVSDGSDVSAFIAGYRNQDPTAEWWEENLDLDRYYSYRTIVEGIHHYDIAYGKNYLYYHNPETDKFQVMPWDLDLTWADNMYGSGQHDFAIKVANNPAFRVDYENRVRELRDLLFNEEQTGLLIDDMAALVYTPGEASWVDADRAMWDANPILRSSYVNSRKAGNGRFYERSSTDDFAGMVQLMKNYVATRGRRLDRLDRTDVYAPETPSVEFTGESGYPTNGLSFRSSAFADPDADSTFLAMEWRIAEITDPTQPLTGDRPSKYEVNATHESGVLTEFAPNWTVPPNKIDPGGVYRVRARMQDNDGHWSHWSEPVQFVAGEPLPTELSDSIRITELHYHPADPSDAERQAGFVDADEFEFIELLNTGQNPVDLQNTAFVLANVDGDEQGVEFFFADGSITNLQPGQRLLVVENIEAFEFRYGAGFPIAGQWSGKLSNAGERITLADNGAPAIEITYDDGWHASTDGGGYSLELVDLGSTDASTWNARSGWTASERIGGTPAASRVLGDVNSDLLVDDHDIDLIFAAIAAQDSSPHFDVNHDKSVGPDDATYLIESLLDTVAGDADLDGRVSFADFLVLSARFGQVGASWSEGDFNGDLTVSFPDFLLLSANFRTPDLGRNLR